MDKQQREATSMFIATFVTIHSGYRVEFENEEGKYQDHKILVSDNEESAIAEAKSIAENINKECNVHVYQAISEGARKKVHPKRNDE